jgi:hypothetical protein
MTRTVQATLPADEEQDQVNFCPAMVELDARPDQQVGLTTRPTSQRPLDSNPGTSDVQAVVDHLLADTEVDSRIAHREPPPRNGNRSIFGNQ